MACHHLFPLQMKQLHFKLNLLGFECVAIIFWPVTNKGTELKSLKYYILYSFQ
jgi:hypothetical protein